MARIVIKDDDILDIFKRWDVTELKNQVLTTSVFTKELKRLNPYKQLVGYTVLQKLKDMEKRGIIARQGTISMIGEGRWYIREAHKESF